MIITVWRVEKVQYLKESSTGNGAKKVGGRWNRPGTPVVYSADSKALAVLELLVQLVGNEAVENRFVIPITFDDSLGRIRAIQFVPSIEQNGFFAPDYRIKEILNERKNRPRQPL